ncbi:MAG: glycosyltransferase [Verrucomicrobiia bacterium]
MSVQLGVVSFIIPAHNEGAFLARTLQAVHESARAIGQAYEIIVVNDASTDGTSEIARQSSACIVNVNHRQIAATRNSGAHAARGGRFFFVDADTTINPRVLAAALRQMDKGAAGGGALCCFDGAVPHYARLLLWWLGLFMRLVGISGGAFMFCTREAFLATGGFDERLFGAEDAAMSWALKREGQFVVLWPSVLTSGRRARGIHGFRMVATLLHMAVVPKILRKRSRVKEIWYESNRNAEEIPNSFAIKIFNTIALLLMILIIIGPLWIIPWPEALLRGPLGTIRFVSGVIGLHFGILLFPCIYFLGRIVVRQERWPERIKLVVLIALCTGLAWGNTRELVRFWWPAAFQKIHSRWNMESNVSAKGRGNRITANAQLRKTERGRFAEQSPSELGIIRFAAEWPRFRHEPCVTCQHAI